MPSKSPAQARMMAAAAHDPAFAEKVGVPQKVARDFNQADKGGALLQRATARKLRKGSRPEKGETMAHERGESRAFEAKERD